MATLTVTTTTDFSAQVLNDINVIDFDSTDISVTATFASTQFNNTAIKLNVTFDGSSAADTVRVDVSGQLLADEWQATNWNKFDSIILEGGADENFIRGSNMAETINGGDGDDTVIGSGGRDLLNGGNGDDAILSFDLQGPDVIDGGSGTDRAFIRRESSAANLTLDIISGGGGSNIGDGTTIKNVEQIEFISGSGNDTLGGGKLDDDLRGGSGNDTLLGRGGEDNLTGGEGDDVIDGGAGADRITADIGNGLSSDGGNDILRGGAGNDEIFTGDGPAVIDGGANTDSVFIDRETSAISFNFSIAAGGGGTDIGDGSSIANVEALHFTGGSGKDRVTGGNLQDQLNGGDGNDTLEGGAGEDFLDGGDGKDTLIYTKSAAAVEIDLATGVAAGGDAKGDTIANFEIVKGSAFGDDLSGDGGINTLTGAGGNDALAGRSGKDTLLGGNGADFISGGGGNDVMTGGSGRDFMFGGSGKDTFTYGATSDSGPSAAARDVILDFLKGSDTIDLSAIDAKDGSGTANDTFTFVAGEGSAFTGAAGQVVFFFSGGSTVIALDTDGDAAAESHIELVGQINLAAGDFTL